MRIISSQVISVLVLTSAACLYGSNPSMTQESMGAPATACPDAVKQSIAARFPDASMTKCKPEHEDGRDQFEVKLTNKGGDKIEVDVAPDGRVLQTDLDWA